MSDKNRKFRQKDFDFLTNHVATASWMDQLNHKLNRDLAYAQITYMRESIDSEMSQEEIEYIKRWLRSKAK